MNSIGTRDEAQVLANRIMDYWGRKGYLVITRLKPLKVKAYDEDGEGDLLMMHGFVVRSDMVNGWPREVYERMRRAALA